MLCISPVAHLRKSSAAESAPERLGSLTFGSGSVRRASDGRCHFTITTGNTQPGPDAMPLAQEVGSAPLQHYAAHISAALHVGWLQLCSSLCSGAAAARLLPLLHCLQWRCHCHTAVRSTEQKLCPLLLTMHCILATGHGGAGAQAGRQWRRRCSADGGRPRQQPAQQPGRGPAARTDGAPDGAACSW